MLLQLTPLDAFLGILLAILSFSFKNIGYVLQKSGVNQAGVVQTSADSTAISPADDKTAAMKILKKPVWWAGQLLTFLGAVCLVLAYIYVPITLAMPFMGIGMVILVIFCRIYLKEEISSKEWMASIVIIIGIIFATLNFSEMPEGSNLLGDYFALYIKPVAIIYFIISIGGIFLAIFWSKKNQWKGASIIFGIGAGVIGGSSLLFQAPFSKGLGQLGSSTEPYFILMWIISLIVIASGGVGAIVSLNKGYMYGEGILVAPLYAVNQMLFPIIGGIIVLGEWRLASTITIALQSIGITIIALGVFFLSYANEQKKHKK
jgi:drug/metabolite transporter (DMT)-like permease